MFSSLLVPIDGSEDSHAALKIACQLAAPVQGKIHVLNVRDPYPDLHQGEMLTVAAAIKAVSVELAEKEGEAIIAEALREITSMPGYENEFDTLVKQGSPAEVIIEEAKRLEVDAIIMGSRGLSDIKGLLVGSVSHKVTHVAHCMVISIHQRRAG
ncbi:universal stress protein [Salinicola sp. MIT1003]|uniref:universal stress protein n=1 Tax=Salinicola sp. MIT1003 TaxID=1882734 RepID=UPI0008DE64AA|nr:universal stress protein [Salinicola sp. MIT1003]OHZ00119.1 hypothetical protein BC443_10165 [Salinicola sp. MIT1003]